jgi:hypothetical protein
MSGKLEQRMNICLCLDTYCQDDRLTLTCRLTTTCGGVTVVEGRRGRESKKMMTMIFESCFIPI